MKETYYFQHDYNARGDEKIINLLKVTGWAGYGLFWALVEKLYEANGMIRSDFDLLAYDLHTDAKLIQQVVKDFGLFYFKGKKFGSRSVEKRLLIRHEKSELAKASAAHRWGITDAMRTHSERNAEAMLERKGKESKRNEIKEKEITTSDSILFCEYNDKGQGRCIERKGPGASKFCPEHQLKIRDKFLMKQEKKNAPDVPSLKSFS